MEGLGWAWKLRVERVSEERGGETAEAGIKVISGSRA